MDYQHLTKDRSLGTVELKVSGLAEASDDPHAPFVSTGRKEVADPIRLDHGKAFKGHLHYIAEFVPTIPVKGVKFESKPNEVQGSLKNGDAERDNATDSSSVSSSEHDHGVMPRITATQPIGGHQRKRNSVDTTRSFQSATEVKDADSNESAVSVTSPASHPTNQGSENPDGPSNPRTSSEQEKNGEKVEEVGVVMTKEELLRHRMLTIL